MVNPAQLEAFDLLLWVGNGQHAARISSLSQPTISRSAHHVARTLGLTLRKVRSEWHVAGEESRLAQERSLHQQGRLQGNGRLRLEAGALSSRMVAEPSPTGWILGRPDAINQPRSLQLVRQRVIDAWICTSALDLPDEPERDDLTVQELCRMPVRLVASRHHPLAGRRGLEAADLSPYPSVALMDPWFPRSAAQLQRQGLWRDPHRLNHHRPEHWEGRTADGQTLAYASPWMLAQNPELCPLDFDLHLEQCLALVVRREHAELPPIRKLHGELQRRVELLPPGPSADDAPA